MNIFVLDKDPVKCAQKHYDVHVKKMCVEYAQILSSCFHILDRDNIDMWGKGIYKLYSKNHPAIKWACDSFDNYIWLQELWIALLREYYYRFGKKHASTKLKYLRRGYCPMNIVEYFDRPAWYDYESKDFIVVNKEDLIVDGTILSKDDPILWYNYLYKLPKEHGGKLHLYGYTRRKECD